MVGKVSDHSCSNCSLPFSPSPTTSSPLSPRLEILQFGMAPGGPDGGPIGPMGGDMVPPVMNGMSNPGDGLDGMKSSPANGPGTPREEPTMGYDIPPYGQENVNENFLPSLA